MSLEDCVEDREDGKEGDVMGVCQVAKKVLGVTHTLKHPSRPLTVCGRLVALATVSRPLVCIVPFLFLVTVAICLFPGRALSYTNLYCVYPTILQGGSTGTDITGKTGVTAYVGQQIVLYANYTLPSGGSFNSQSWSVQGSTVGGFVDTATNGGYSPVSFNNVQQTTFYWVVQANPQTVTFTLNWSYNGINTTSKATTTFNVQGPTSVGLNPPTPTMGNWNLTCRSSSLGLGCNSGPTYGITFNGIATSPGVAGTYEWAQIVSTDNGTVTYDASTQAPWNGPTGLDGRFPIATGLSASDSPIMSLYSACSEETWSLGFTMYFMWNPGTTTNDIAAPLGYVNWSAFGDAENSNNNWTVQSDSSQSANEFVLSPSSIVWSATASSYPPPTCP